MKKLFRNVLSSCLALALSAGNLLPVGSGLHVYAQAPVMADGFYQVASADDLLWAAENPEKNYILTEDIDLSDKPEWIAIGTDEEPFSGIFNGAGHSVKLGISREETAAGPHMVGLFGVVTGAVTNLTVTGSFSVKLRGGYAAPIAATLAGGKILNCTNKASITAEEIVNDETGIMHVGGIVGAVRGGAQSLVKNCTNDGEIQMKALNLPMGDGELGDGTRGALGGIVGYTCNGVAADITNCINNGNIFVNGGNDDIGGILGMTCSNNDNSIANITYCGNKGDIIVHNIQGERAAGIVAYIKNGKLCYSYNTGNVLAYTDDGKTLAHRDYGTHFGILGYANLPASCPLEMTYCYTAGEQAAEAELGVIRNPNNGTLKNNFCLEGREDWETEVNSNLHNSRGEDAIRFTSAEDLLPKLTAAAEDKNAYKENPVPGGYPVLYHEVPAALPDNALGYESETTEEVLGNNLSDLYFVMQAGSQTDAQGLTATAEIRKDAAVLKTVTLTEASSGSLFDTGDQTYQAADGCVMFTGTAYGVDSLWTQATITVKKGDEIVYAKTVDKARQSFPHPFEDLPAYPDGVIGETVYNAGPGLAVDDESVTDTDSQMVVISQTSAATFQSYMEDLIHAGFEKLWENASEQNIYCLLQKDANYYYAYYTAYTQTVRIIQDNSTTLDLSALSQDAVGDGKTEFYVYALDYCTTGQYSETDYWSVDCGAQMVLKLADDSVFILDGGHQRQSSQTAQEAFMNFLYEITGADREKGEKIRIRGWFFSHAHDDHVYFAKAFIDSYHENLMLENVLFNFPSYHVVGNGYAVSTFEVKESISRYYPDCKVAKLHSGQEFSVQGVTFKVMYTHEDNVSAEGVSRITNFNDTSTIMKMTIDGKTFMLLGDYFEENCLLKMYSAAELHSDCVQVAHHGYNDLPELYKAIGAPLAFYSNAEANSGADPDHHNHSKYLGVINGAENVEVLFADDTQKITVENGELVHETIPNYRSTFTTLSVPELSEALLTGEAGIVEDPDYIMENKALLNDKIIDKSVIGTPGITTQSGYCMVDGDLDTKFCSTDALPAAVVWTMKEETAVDSYIIYTGGDTAQFPQRNPKSWVFCGSDDGEQWTVLDSVSNADLPAANLAGTAFKVKNPGAYKYYTVRFFETGASNAFQISEFAIYGGERPADPTIQLDKSSLTLEKGETDVLTAVTTPAGDAVTFTSSDPAVAAVDPNGKVTAVKTGTAVITAKSASGAQAVCTVTVTAKQEPEVIPGDMDANGNVDIADVMEACKVLARQAVGTRPTDEEMARGNLNGDQDFTIADIMEICRILARKG